MNWVTPVADARDAIVEALATGNAPFGLPAAQMREHGSLKMFLYEPRGIDAQPVHEQDEIYVILAGSGTFAIGVAEHSLERMPFGPGDAVFAPAGMPHRFENFTDDFSTWVVMYGPEGGEQPRDNFLAAAG